MPDQRLQVSFELLKDLLFSKMEYGVFACLFTKIMAEIRILKQFLDRAVKSCGVLRSNRQTSALHHLSNLGARVRRGDHRPTARKHGTESGRHYKIGGARSLWKQVYVRSVQQIVESIKRL